MREFTARRTLHEPGPLVRPAVQQLRSARGGSSQRGRCFGRRAARSVRHRRCGRVDLLAALEHDFADSEDLRTQLVGSSEGLYAGAQTFSRVARWCNLIYFDLKLADTGLHRRYTGVSNERILRNLRLTPTLGVPVVVRVPLVPGVTDSEENLRSIAAIVRVLPNVERVDLLSYNRAAGGKYAPLGLEFQPPFDEARAVNANAGIFQEAGIPVTIGE